jgi:hypothetical protein
LPVIELIRKRYSVCVISLCWVQYILCMKSWDLTLVYSFFYAFLREHSMLYAIALISMDDR